jgi:hypothetical protein
MWREYLIYFGTAVAVLNAVLAFTIAMLPMRRSVARLRLAVTALVLAALAVGAVFYTRYQVRIQTEHQQTERREIREQLETLVLEGRTLLNQIRDANRDLPTRPSDEWAQRAEIFIRDKLGERYIPRFRREVAELYGDPNVPTERLAYWRAVRNRVVNLEMIGAEFPPL